MTNIFFTFRSERFKLLKPKIVTAETLHYVEQGVRETEQAFLVDSEIYSHREKDLSILQVRFTVHRK